MSQLLKNYIFNMHIPIVNNIINLLWHNWTGPAEVLDDASKCSSWMLQLQASGSRIHSIRLVNAHLGCAKMSASCQRHTSWICMWQCPLEPLDQAVLLCQTLNLSML